MQKSRGWIIRFNPKLVQLEVSRLLNFVKSVSEFQSQTGSIRGPNISLLFAKTTCFNPKLVQLEDSCLALLCLSKKMFQSQTGSIRGPIFTVKSSVW